MTESGVVMPKKKRSLWFWLGMAVLVVVGLFALCRVSDAIWWESALRRRCDKADRVVVDLDVYPKKRKPLPYDPVFPTFTIDGEKAAADLVDAFDLTPNWLMMRCRCFDDMVFKFYRGDTLVATVSYLHGEAVDWRDRGSFGYEFLSSRSDVAVRNWLNSHNCPSPTEARVLIDESRKAAEEAMQKMIEAGMPEGGERGVSVPTSWGQ